MLALIKNKMYNGLRLYREYVYLFTPIIGLTIFFVSKYIFNIQPQSNENLLSNIINVSGILTGFLFTTISTFSALPSNKFTQLLKETGYFKSIRLVLLVGIISFIISFILGIYLPVMKIINLFFITGVSETVAAAYYFYQITKYAFISN